MAPRALILGCGMVVWAACCAPVESFEMTSADAGDGGRFPVFPADLGNEDWLPCEPTCTGGCFGPWCRILCDDQDECKEAALACPAGYACTVVCTGNKSCENAVLSCGAAESCQVTCDGDGACKNARLDCSEGHCWLDCFGKACEGAEMACGGGSCHAICSGDAVPPTLQGCDAAACWSCAGD